MKEIGQFIIHEEINGKDMPTSVNIFDNSEIEVKRTADGSSVTIYHGKVEDFLLKIHYVHQFLNGEELEKIKTWRR